MSELILDSQAYKHNLNLISSHIALHGSKAELAAVLKDNAYGHGLAQIADLAKQSGIKSVFVKNYAEAMGIKDKFPSITALYGLPQGDFPSNVMFVINDRDSISALPRGTKVELKVNTGMNRNGIESSRLNEFVELILSHGLELVGVFCHNGYGDDENDEFYRTQERFSEVKERVRGLSATLGFACPRFHSLSSSGAVRVASEGAIDDDLVRVGIAGYGYLEAEFDNPIAPKLKPIASLWADRVSTRFLKKGERIGYSGCSQLEADSVISTYDVGYGDGFFRASEHHSVHTAAGYKILPRSSMDCFSCLCDEERICVFDDARSVARSFGTISYEILTHLSPSIKRTII